MGRSGRAARTGVAAVITLILVGVIGCGQQNRPLPGQQRCVATASENSVAVDPEQAHYASIIAGLSVRRGLPARAASIALATAYQESGIRNLKGGDRDSVGLFQQRPSQGWGKKKQLRDPYYATNKFYDALIKIDGWENGDITEIAQKIQISGHPDAYRDHEADGRILASVLTGHSPAGIRCLVRGEPDGKPVQLANSLRETLGTKSKRSGRVITIDAKTPQQAWATAHHGVANAHRFGVVQVQVGDRQLLVDDQLGEWQQTGETIQQTRVRLTVR